MGLKHWIGVLLVILMAGVVKSGMLFFRLAILAVAGLAGLFLLHILATDYRKIQANRPKAFGLFKRSIVDEAVIGADIDTMYSTAHRKLEEIDSISKSRSNNVELPLLSAAAEMDPLGCARRYICTIAATPAKARTPIEKAVLDLIESSKNAQSFKTAMELGRDVASQKQCNIHYPRCTYSITEMLRLIQPIY